MRQRWSDERAGSRKVHIHQGPELEIRRVCEEGCGAYPRRSAPCPPGLREPRGSLTAVQKSAEGILGRYAGRRPERSPKGVEGKVSRSDRLMTPLRPPCQLELALPMPGRGEAPRPEAQEVEAVTATAEPESLALTDHLMEAICAPDNLEAALRAVVRNKGAPGIDGITVKQLPGVLQARWPEIEGQLRQGRYQPQPVRRVTIPKP